MPPIIEVNDLWKRFPARRGARTLIGRGGLSDYLRGQKTGHFDALKAVNLAIDRGEAVGLIGANGSGKSTLLKVIAGVTAPSQGHVVVEGRVASLLELGAGFHPILTGRENVYLNAALLGVRRKTVRELFDAIVAFSELEDFIDQPVDTYSSGMFVRLAFSVAIHANPDVFLVDEVLAVGDEAFQRKCRQRIGELREEGKTILFVSHDLGLVNALCDRVYLLDHGQVLDRGAARATIDYYLRRVGAEQGVHTMQAGPLEAIFSNGRLSLFHDLEPITPPAGWTLQANALGAWHGANAADWEVTDRGPTRCTARGRAARLPIVWEWSIALEDDTITWRIACRCERPTEVDLIAADLHLANTYSHWLYADLEGAFPAHAPEDTDRTRVAASEEGARIVGAFPAASDDATPPLVIDVDEGQLPLRLAWANTDYIGAARILEVSAHVPPDARPLPEGDTIVATVRARVVPDADAARAAAALDRTIVAGQLEARFVRGTLELRHEGRAVSHLLHGWASLHANHLWHDSHDLRWFSPEHDGESMRITGASRRLPLQQAWEITPDGEGRISVSVWLDVASSLRIHEHHFSLMLPDAYDRWRTTHEQGDFRPIPRDQADWVHLNEDYPEGGSIMAYGPMRPAITLAATPDADSPQPRMTALNAAHDQRGRVLQALRSVDASGGILLAPGRHCLFAGTITVSATSEG